MTIYLFSFTIRTCGQKPFLLTLFGCLSHKQSFLTLRHLQINSGKQVAQIYSFW